MFPDGIQGPWTHRKCRVSAKQNDTVASFLHQELLTTWHCSYVKAQNY